jgi:hypothetical protein
VVGRVTNIEMIFFIVVEGVRELSGPGRVVDSGGADSMLQF